MHRHHVKCYGVQHHLFLQQFVPEPGLERCKILFLCPSLWLFPSPRPFPYSLSPLDHLLNLLFVSLFLLGPSDRQACQIHFLIKAV